MEENKKIAALEMQVKKLLQRLIKLETANVKNDRTIRMLKTKIYDLETNVEFLSRR